MASDTPIFDQWVRAFLCDSVENNLIKLLNSLYTTNTAIQIRWLNIKTGTHCVWWRASNQNSPTFFIFFLLVLRLFLFFYQHFISSITHSNVDCNETFSDGLGLLTSCLTANLFITTQTHIHFGTRPWFRIANNAFEANIKVSNEWTDCVIFPSITNVLFIESPFFSDNLHVPSFFFTFFRLRN